MKKFKFTKREKEEMMNAVNDNSYAAHPENVLLTMLTDKEDPALRAQAADIIIQIRNRKRMNPDSTTDRWVSM